MGFWVWSRTSRFGLPTFGIINLDRAAVKPDTGVNRDFLLQTTSFSRPITGELSDCHAASVATYSTCDSGWRPHSIPAESRRTGRAARLFPAGTPDRRGAHN